MQDDARALADPPGATRVQAAGSGPCAGDSGSGLFMTRSYVGSSPAEVVAFYTSELTRLGWSIEPHDADLFARKRLDGIDAWWQLNFGRPMAVADGFAIDFSAGGTSRCAA